MKKKIAILLTIVILSSTFFLNFKTIAKGNNHKDFEKPYIHSSAVILMEEKSGEVIFEKDSLKKLFPASTTKILTAILAMENGDLEELVAVGEEIKDIPKNSSNAGLIKGEKISLINLLRALMLSSGNDAAQTIAVHIARKTSNDEKMEVNRALGLFVEMMNKRANELGAINSNFMNPHGYHDDNHYSTARDMALIAKYALEKPVFKKIIKLKKFSISVDLDGNKGHTGKINHIWINTNQLIQDRSKFYYKYAMGIKTGHTNPAGFCLISYANRDGMGLIGVVMNAPDETQWEDSINLFEYGFNNYCVFNLENSRDDIPKIQVDESISRVDRISLIYDKNFSKLLLKSDIPKIKKYFTWDKEIIKSFNENTVVIGKTAKKGDVVGKVKYKLNDELLVELNLILDGDIKGKSNSIYLYIFIPFVLLTVIFAGRIIKIKNSSIAK